MTTKNVLQREEKELYEICFEIGNESVVAFAKYLLPKEIQLVEAKISIEGRDCTREYVNSSKSLSEIIERKRPEIVTIEIEGRTNGGEAINAYVEFEQPSMCMEDRWESHYYFYAPKAKVSIEGSNPTYVSQLMKKLIEVTKPTDFCPKGKQ